MARNSQVAANKCITVFAVVGRIGAERERSSASAVYKRAIYVKAAVIYCIVMQSIWDRNRYSKIWGNSISGGWKNEAADNGVGCCIDNVKCIDAFTASG
ncbi:hypothetical protein ACYG9R_28405 [Mesorhizobium sp. RSR565B]